MNFFDLEPFIKTIGLLGVIGVIFAETGLLIGFFLPGDSLLFTAGFLASQDFLNFPLLLIGTFVAAVVGDSLGYSIGRKIGPAIFNKEDSLFFSKKNLDKAHQFYEKHGGKTIILARFMPIVRTFAPVVAGVGKMKYSHFIIYNVVGGLIWTVGLTSLGYYLGNLLPNPDKYILPIILLIIFLSVLPGLFHALKSKETRHNIYRFIFRK
jgi:membrane-associated protein